LSITFDIAGEAFQEAYNQALIAKENNEVPAGSVIVKGNKIIAAAPNRIIEKKDPTAHAEILAIREAAKKLNNERLVNCDLYCTLEPCSMCTGAIILARIRKVYFLNFDFKLPGLRSVLELKNHNHYPEWECNDSFNFQYDLLLKNFFREKRAKSTDTN
jgi:tRNA(adenine34) deaminase